MVGANSKMKTSWWFSKIFYFHPYLAKIPILITIFQMGWFNHQLEDILANSWRNIHRGFPMIAVGSENPARKPPFGCTKEVHFEEPGYIYVVDFLW